MSPEELEKKFLEASQGDSEAMKQFDSREDFFQSQHFANIKRQHGQMLLQLKNEPSTFGPFFAERVVNYIKNRKSEIDYQIFWFFKKYQIIALGFLVALITLNVFLANEFTIQSMLGIETTDENFQNTDFYELLTDALNP